MSKRITIPAAAIMAIIGYPVHAQLVTVPTTAVSFSAAAIPVPAGTIDFWAKLSGFSGQIPGGTGPFLFIFNDGASAYEVSFNANDGLGHKGLIGKAGSGFATGSSDFFTGSQNTYEDVLGAGGVDTWHHYTLKWNQNGVAGLPDPSTQKVAVYLDNALSSTSWFADPAGTFPAPRGATLDLIAGGLPTSSFPSGARIAIDEFKIFDGADNLLLYNTFDSIHDVTHSAVGLSGAFSGLGDPTFVPGILGNALEATPLIGVAVIPEPEICAMLLAGLSLLGFMSRRRRTAQAKSDSAPQRGGTIRRWPLLSTSTAA